MPTKTELISQVNKEFPEHWPRVVSMNPRIRFPTWTTYPTLLGVDIGNVTHEYGTEADLVARFRNDDGEEYELKGAFFDNHHDSGVLFTSNPGAFPGTQEESILNHLFGNIFYGDGKLTGPEMWKSLGD